jgi:hypothetical protein
MPRQRNVTSTFVVGSRLKAGTTAVIVLGFNCQRTKTVVLKIVIASQRVGAKRRPMTGSAKQSISPRKESVDCSSLRSQ